MRRVLLCALLSGCVSSSPGALPPIKGPAQARSADADVLEPLRPASGRFALVGGTILDGLGGRIEGGTVLVEDGRITAVGPEVDVPSEMRTYDARGQFITPGIVDTHSHMGVYPVPFVPAHADGNELTDPTTPYVFSEHAFWPQDPALQAAVIGGVTTIQVLPGSGNVIGGRSVVLKLRPRRAARAMRFPGAPFGLKMACGENPKRVYGEKGRQPGSRMGNIYKLRQAFIEAQAYRRAQREYRDEFEAWKKKHDAAAEDPKAPRPGEEPKSPKRDLGKETLAQVLEGDIRVHIHCYRADEMLQMIALGDELGYQVTAFHHAVEAYKIADVLAERGIHAAVWADWWGFKVEAYDSTEANAAILSKLGGKPNIHSDSPIGVQRLNQEAAKAMAAGRHHGLETGPAEAIQWLTKNPAEALGVLEQTGTLEVGKMADIVSWDADPFSIYAKTTRVFIDGELVFDRGRSDERWSDFLVGSEVEEDAP
ncbi:MAG: amidohydrolase family protein [Myxococcota bacterium]